MRNRALPVGDNADERAPVQTNLNEWLWVGAITESDARSTGVQLKSAAKLSTVIGLNQ